MSIFRPTKQFNSKTYTQMAVSEGKENAKKDKRILKRHGYRYVRIVPRNKEYGKVRKYEVWARK